MVLLLAGAEHDHLHVQSGEVPDRLTDEIEAFLVHEARDDADERDAFAGRRKSKVFSNSSLQRLLPRRLRAE